MDFDIKKNVIINLVQYKNAKKVQEDIISIFRI